MPWPFTCIEESLERVALGPQKHPVDDSDGDDDDDDVVVEPGAGVERAAAYLFCTPLSSQLHELFNTHSAPRLWPLLDPKRLEHRQSAKILNVYGHRPTDRPSCRCCCCCLHTVMVLLLPLPEELFISKFYRLTAQARVLAL